MEISVPAWVPDADALECGLCTVRFGIITRRHHCRSCGNVFCHQCCSQRLRLPDRGIQDVVRVCSECYKETNLEDLWEAESFTARFYLRQSEGFSFSGTLFEASRRDAREKSMFSVTDGQGREYILNVYSRGPRCVVPYLTSEAARSAFQRVLVGVRHPYVWPVTEAKFLEDRDRALVLCRYAARGSLRDVMHKAIPKAVFGQKYRSPATPLPAQDIALYGRQILEALLYLTARKFSVSHLHAGNVLIEKRCCYITSLENQLLGLLPLTPVNTSSEVVAFGRLLFEMATGSPLSSPSLPRLTARNCTPPFHRIITAILCAKSPEDMLSLQRLADLPVFSDVELVADVRFIHQSPMDSKCIRLLDQVSASAGPIPERTLTGGSAEPATSPISPPIERGQKGGAEPKQHPPRRSTPPPPAPPAPPPPPSPIRPPRASGIGGGTKNMDKDEPSDGRNALLDSIRNSGVKLLKQTNSVHW